MNKKIIGLDIGGTTVKLGLLNRAGDVLEKWEIPTEHGPGIVETIYASILSRISRDELNQQVLGIGVGAPGFVNEGKVEAVNLGWKGLPLQAMLQERFEQAVFVENDANLAALGEYWREHENRVSDLIFVTLGTGVGSGIIVNGQILHGFNGTAGELGHVVVDYHGYKCNCGRIGCLDTIASATGIVRKTKERMSAAPSGKLAEFYRTHGSLSAKDVFHLASQGDADCLETIHYSARMLGIALANAAALVNPSKILIGGGVSQAGNSFLQFVDSYFKQYALERIGATTKLELAKLGNDAGVIGAAYLVLRSLEPEFVVPGV